MREQLIALRNEMKRNDIDVYLVPMDDFHQSEYVSDFFRTVRYVSGFTGESCKLVVSQSAAALFTDGRYFIQAEAELAGSGIELMKMGEPGVPSVFEYVDTLLPEGGTFGFDGRCLDYNTGIKLQDVCQRKGAYIEMTLDLVGNIWKDRPALPLSRVWVLDEKYSGRSSHDKLADVRAQMSQAGADLHVISSLTDIAWILNLRADDIPCNPVFLSYLLIDMEDCYLFIQKDELDEKATAYLAELGVKICEYDAIYDALSQLQGRNLMLEPGQTNYRLIMGLDESMNVIETMLPSSLMKAKKNPVEMANIAEAHLKDGVAMTKFSYFVKHAYDASGELTEEAKTLLQSDKFTEITAADYLERLRREQDGMVELSFSTISAYGDHAALPHYSPNRSEEVIVKPSGLYLVDSGGHYLEGTTDITRTYSMGMVTDEERRHYTMVLIAMLRLGAVQFLYGSCGVTLDYVARSVFWKEGLNFNHGTGHGVGYLLSVHERPNGIRYRLVPERMDSGAMEEGYVTSDEPGLYIEGKHGIRIENLTMCRKAFTNEYGTFMKFEFLTMCPIDLDPVDLSLLTAEDKELLNSYHRMVREKLSDRLEGDVLKWLNDVTKEV